VPVQRIDIDKFLALASQFPVFDVRSPGEFNHAHIPGAFCFSLFSNDERAVVGTIYKQEGREPAIKKGLEFFGPRMKSVVEEAENIIRKFYSRQGNDDSQKNRSHNTVLVHCWRGGMRSEAIAWLLDIYGFRVYTLAGGYKTFRHYVLDTFGLPFKFRILGGYTGSAKTELLSELKKRGEKTIDLESLANHKGSAFGNIGMPAQPGQEMFENLLAMELRNFQIESTDDQPIWLEDESQRIGLVNIPHVLWKNMRSSPVYFLDIPFEVRLDHVVQEYGKLDNEKLAAAIGRISQKLGSLNANTAITHLREGHTREAFSILLAYYDRFYFKALHNREAVDSLLHTISCKSIIPENANLLIQSFQTEKT
jgi:tRNA 2-selenouridine synthase